MIARTAIAAGMAVLSSMISLYHIAGLLYRFFPSKRNGTETSGAVDLAPDSLHDTEMDAVVPQNLQTA